VFPEQPPVSESCKSFIRRCLTRQQALRPDASELVNDPYWRAKPTAARAPKSGQAQPAQLLLPPPPLPPPPANNK